jgi:hypothetical protein
MGYYDAAREPFYSEPAPFTHRAMVRAYYAGQWKARDDYARRSLVTIARSMQPMMGVFEAMTVAFRNAAEVIKRGIGAAIDQHYALTFEQDDAGASAMVPDVTPITTGSP